MHDYLNPQLDTLLREISAQGLAYVGDAVFELIVRTKLCSQGALPVDKMHKKAVEYVSANAQATIADKIIPILSDEELDIYKRGRNANAGSIPKNSSGEEYHSATGLETLFGYLYLSGQRERINELFEVIND